jgi:hypothetical protein
MVSARAHIAKLISRLPKPEPELAAKPPRREPVAPVGSATTLGKPVKPTAEAVKQFANPGALASMEAIHELGSSGNARSQGRVPEQARCGLSGEDPALVEATLRPI